MKNHYLNLEVFRTTVETGGIKSVAIVARGNDFYIEAETKNDSKAILVKSKTDEIRSFKDIQKAFVLLWGMGIRDAKIDARNWQPEQASLGRVTRPDRSKALREMHAASKSLLDNRVG